MFGIGMPELIIILVLALIVIGPKKLPDMARSLGKGMAEFKRASSDFRKHLEQEAPAPEQTEAAADHHAAKEAAETTAADVNAAGKACA